MKNLIKVSSYTLATALVFVVSQSSALAAGTTENSGSLSAGQVIGGLALLIAAILVPTMKSAHKAKA
ncbi:MAG TPA: hypothetical protein DIC22_05155 [Chitinophagaceae bacterium]|nr:hypothetical protein [Chitinophagaceae bacterium]